MKKKTVLVETSKVGKSWSIKVTSSDPLFRDYLGKIIRDYATETSTMLVNASDPFGEVRVKRKKKNNGKIPTGEIPANSETLKS